MAGLILSDPAFAPAPRIGNQLAEGGGAAPWPHAPRLRTGCDGAGSAVVRRCLVATLDRLLRRLYGIREFSDRPQCLLRIAPARAPAGVRLPDGICVLPGSPILELHLWNEHLAGLSSDATGLGRGLAWRRHLVASLAELADHLEREPSLCGVVALRARPALVPRSRLDQLLRIARALGFTPTAIIARNRLCSRLSEFGAALVAYALAWAFNPATLQRNGFKRERCELWISRHALRARYGGHGTGQRRWHWRGDAGDFVTVAPPLPRNAWVSTMQRCPDAGALIRAFSEEPEAFEIRRGCLRHRPSRCRLSFDAAGSARISRRGRAVWPISREASDELREAVGMWDSTYWRPRVARDAAVRRRGGVNRECTAPAGFRRTLRRILDDALALVAVAALMFYAAPTLPNAVKLPARPLDKRASRRKTLPAV